MKWPMFLFIAIMIATYGVTFVGTTLYIADDAIGPMSSMRVESAVLRLGNEVEQGFVPSCFIFIFIAICIASGRSQRSLIPLSITRKELMGGTSIYLLVQSLIMIAFMYAASVLARLVLNIRFVTELRGMRPLWVLGGNGTTLVERFTYTLAYMIGMSGPILLFGCLMTRWKKQIFFLLGFGFVLLILLSVRGDWMQFLVNPDNAQSLLEKLTRIYNWIRDYYVEGGILLVTLKQLLIYAVAMALSYPVVRWTRVVK